MFCPKCGAQLKDSAKFCTACGASIAAPRPSPAPTQSSTPFSPVYPMPAKKMSGGLIALIVVAAVLMLAAVIVVLTLLFGNLFDHSDDTSAPATDALITADNVPVDGFDIASLNGVYYCAQETGSTLELRATGGQLSIYKTHYGATDVSTLIPAPSAPSFTINYDNRLIEFSYSAGSRSVTVTEGGFSSFFTTDGDQSWVINAQSAGDAFHDPNGYILPTDSRYISESELYPFDEEQVKLIRNEIYARHGYSFSMEKFRDYFNSKNWYFENPNVNVNTFGTNQMNSYERANIDTIKAYENRMGW